MDKTLTYLTAVCIAMLTFFTLLTLSESEKFALFSFKTQNETPEIKMLKNNSLDYRKASYEYPISFHVNEVYLDWLRERIILNEEDLRAIETPKSKLEIEDAYMYALKYIEFINTNKELCE